MTTREERYASVRDVISNGDLLFFKATKWNQKVITEVTGGKYSHCGLAVWLTDGITNRLSVVEATSGGRRIISLSHYADRPFTVLNVGLEYDKVAEYVMGNTGLPYGMLDFASIGLKDFALRFGIKLKMPNTPGEVCSEFLAGVLQKAEYSITDTLISPSDLYNYCETAAFSTEQYVP